MNRLADTSLSGRVAVVTGGSRGIGRGIAEALAARGAAVAVTYRERADAAEQVVKGIVDGGGRAWAGECDVSKPDSVEHVFEQIGANLGPADILVNNAGISADAHIVMMDTHRWDTVIRTNLDGAYHCVRACVRGMLLRRWGRVINVTSPSALMPLPGQANYAASKAGIIGLTRALSRDLAAKGVLVNAVSPGLIETEMLDGISPQALEGYLKAVAIGRTGNVSEIGAVVAFLASDAASYITGQVIAVDGGLS